MQGDVVNKGNQTYRNDLVIVRVLATILVLLGHSWFFQGYAGFNEPCLSKVVTPDWLVFVNKVIYTFHMQLFFALSGSLLYISFKKKRKFSLLHFLISKGKRLLVPFLVIGILYLIPIHYIVGHNDGILFRDVIINTLVLVKWAHLWFMPTLFWLMCWGYLVLTITPPRWSKCIKLNNNTTLLLYVFLFVLFFHYIGFPKSISLDILCLDRSLNYCVVFFFGIIMEKYNVIDKMSKIQFFIISILFVLMVTQKLFYTIIVESFISSRISLFLDDLRGIFAVLCIFYLCKQIKNNTPTMISKIDKSSYEIYLYSEPINYLVLYFAISLNGWPNNGFIFYIIRFLLSFSIAYMLSKVITINFGQKAK